MPIVEVRSLETQSRRVSIFVRPFLILHFLYFDSSVLILFPFLVFAKMELGLKRALVVKKAVTLQLKAGNMSTPTARTNQKRKNQGNEERPTKKIISQPVALDLTNS